MKIFHTFKLQCQYDNNERMKRLESKRTNEGKKKRIQMKMDRTEQQKLRCVQLCILLLVCPVTS